MFYPDISPATSQPISSADVPVRARLGRTTRNPPVPASASNTIDQSHYQPSDSAQLWRQSDVISLSPAPAPRYIMNQPHINLTSAVADQWLVILAPAFHARAHTLRYELVNWHEYDQNTPLNDQHHSAHARAHAREHTLTHSSHAASQAVTPAACLVVRSRRP